MKYVLGIIVFISIFQSRPSAQNQHPAGILYYSVDLHKITPKYYFSLLRLDSDSAKGAKFISFGLDAPTNWIKLDDVKYFMQFINSTEKCRCIVKIHSSYIPPDNNFSTLGGQAMNLIDSYRKNEPYFYGLWNCSKNDILRAKGIMTWWKSINKKK